MTNCLLPLIKPPQWAFLTNFLQHLLNYCNQSQGVIQKSETGKIVILPFPTLLSTWNPCTSVFSDNGNLWTQFWNKSKRKDHPKKVYVLSSAETAPSKQSKQWNISPHLAASHQNQVPLDTVYQCAKLGQEGVVEEKKFIWGTWVSYHSKIHEDLTR